MSALSLCADSKISKIPPVFFPQERITDSNLLELNSQLYVMIEKTGKKPSRTQRSLIKTYLKALESAPKEQIYSYPVGAALWNLAHKKLITQQEYDTYSSQRNEYFSNLNAPFREHIIDKMTLLHDLSYKEVEPLYSFLVRFLALTRK